MRQLIRIDEKKKRKILLNWNIEKSKGHILQAGNLKKKRILK